MESSPQRIPLGFAPALLASFFFGICTTYSRGTFSLSALVMVLLGTLTLGFQYTVAARGGGQSEVGHLDWLATLLWIGVAGMAWHAWNDGEMVIYPVKAWDLGRTAQAVGLVLILSYAPFLSGRFREPPWLRLARLAALSVTLLVAGYDVVKTSPRPYIDTWVVQQQGAEALEHGLNPYQHVAVRDTGPREAQDVPYTYPPTQVYLSLPAHWLGGDVRYGLLACIVISGFLLRFIVKRSGLAMPGFLEDAPTLFLWMTPKLFFVLEQSWVDPTQLMLVCAAFAAYVAKRRRLAAVLFGVVLTAKQTMFWLVGISGVLLRFDRKQWAIVAGVGGGLVLPFAIWDFGALKHANFDFVNALPERADALTFNNWFARRLGFHVPGVVGFVLAAITSGLALWRMRGSTARAAVAIAFTYTLFFTFNKWCFTNYYFTLTGLSALAAALSCFPGLAAAASAAPEPAPAPSPTLIPEAAARLVS